MPADGTSGHVAADRRSLLRWQWQGYPRFHRDRVNLLIHIVAVPAFSLGALALPLALAWGRPGLGVAGLTAMVLSLAAQGRGHAREENPPEPFSGPREFVARLFAEQFLTFPRFVLSGGWRRALRGPG